ncbi:MAG TPA: cytochrome c biogenesis protein CcsA [Syntrophales bacterium]|nr:cytochrome c biogenesis protein CcsA [Syntrophales bacterium]HOM06854.1 cytochrome c biogenesis protein CcsA [Syntrophales bacterium]HPC00592.1 cytochrome c biogenesis protein CcsA [Syntrophales bacterium]HPQ06395.1 cytochrome c biogenesis protein CcsA [Syntrophales bacterium]
MGATTILFLAALGSYLASTVIYGLSLRVRRVHTAKTATRVFLAAFVLHGLFMVSTAFLRGRPPLLTAHDTASFFAWTVAGVFLLFQVRTKTRVLGAFVSPLVLLLLLLAAPGTRGETVIAQNLKGPLVLAHVILSVAGEALFALASLAGAVYLLQDNLIKRRIRSPFIRYFPSLGDLDRINAACLLGGFPLLTAGLIAGSLWARVAWGDAWPLDSKLVWTLMAWLVYAFLLHQRLALGWGGRRAALYSVAAFAFLLASFFVEKALFTTIHRFS